MKRAQRRLADADGILIPGGFGGRGIEGKIRAARVARERRIPYLGVCLGMQIAVCEFARHVAGMPGANSTEFDIETEWPVIDLLPEQKEVSDLGGTMRLGADPVKVHAGTAAHEIYGEAVIYERHRHRYEVSISLRKRLETAGLIVSGTSPDERLVEMIELPDHPFFVASQFHPEFKSRPERPAPLFRDFVGAALHRAQDAHPEGEVRASRSAEAEAEPARVAADARRAEPPPPRRSGGGSTTLFAELCAIPSVSGQEAAVSARVVELLDAAGLASQIDAAGNVLTRVGGPGRPARPALLPPRHRPARRHPDRAGHRRRRLGERQRRDPRRRQQGRGRGDARWPPSGSRGSGGPAFELLFTVREETALRRRPGSSTSPSCAARSATSSTTPRRSARS